MLLCIMLTLVLIAVAGWRYGADSVAAWIATRSHRPVPVPPSTQAIARAEALGRAWTQAARDSGGVSG
jgi:hypothetical protein